jgi:hypothetical protein
MGQNQSTDGSEDRGFADSRTGGRTDYYTVLGLERDASEEE